MSKHMRQILADKKGATAIEYGLIAALIVVVMIGGLGYLGNKTTEMWNNVSDIVTKA